MGPRLADTEQNITIIKKRHQQKLVIIALGLAIAFNAPVLLLMNRQVVFAGVPLLYGYVFTVWVLGIVLTYRILKKYA